MAEFHKKWRIRYSVRSFGWVVDEWDGLKWNQISIGFGDYKAAHLYLHANALVECALDNEDWKLL